VQTTLILPHMVQSICEVFILSKKIHRPISTTRSRDNLEIYQDDEPLFKYLGGLELKSASI
jgi:hypothetical protein